MRIFGQLESNVRSYCRSFPKVFSKALGATLSTRDGEQYIDFFAGAGTMNYGHNHPEIKKSVIDYLSEDNLIHGLDMMSEAKEKFLINFKEIILRPRQMDYKIQFPGPTGTNAVECALKLARKVKGRSGIVSFTNAFHGMTLGSLSVTGNASKRKGAGISTHDVTFMPYEGFHGPGVDTLQIFSDHLNNAGSGVDLPAAVIIETVQGEGGLNMASEEWLRGLYKLCRQNDILFIVDDIQIGNGRSGHFFSFEEMDISPDMICLSKSLSGLGLPFAVMLMKPEYDIWGPGEHNGTFRGFNPAFISAAKTLEVFWSDDNFITEVGEKTQWLTNRLDSLASESPFECKRVGRGMMQGLSFKNKSLASKFARHAFDKGLILETSGIDDQVLKLLPPLTIEKSLLEKGVHIIESIIMSEAQ